MYADSIDFLAGEFLSLLDAVERGQAYERRFNTVEEWVDEAVDMLAIVESRLVTL